MVFWRDRIHLLDLFGIHSLIFISLHCQVLQAWEQEKLMKCFSSQKVLVETRYEGEALSGTESKSPPHRNRRKVF